MKKIFLLITFFAFATMANAASTQYSVQENQRQAVAIWQNENLTIHGKHRPYSKVKIFENDAEVSETTTDSSGSFIFTLNKTLSPEIDHQVTIKAYDRFDRVIKDEEGNEDVINKTILAGLQSQGTIQSDDGMPIAGAEISLYNEEGDLLNKFYSNENGNFIITNAPKNAKIKVSGSGIEEEEIEFKGEKQLSITPKIDETNPPKITTIKEFDAPIIDLDKDTNQDDSSNNYIIFIFLAGIIIVGIGAFVAWKIKNKK